MLPKIREDEYLYDVPDFQLGIEDTEVFVEELKVFHGEFSDCFARSESGENFFRYMRGQLSRLERKSVEPIAVSVSGTSSVRALQRSMNDAVWHEDKILRRYHEMLRDDMGCGDAVLIFDESGFVKKGKDSAGVSRQYCGSVGKTENSQVGVFVGYAGPFGYGLADRRLFIPEKWFGDEYGERRRKCGIADDTVFKTKPQLAAEMFHSLNSGGVLPFRYVTADSIYGNSPEFIEAIDSSGKIFMVSVSCDTRCWFHPPVTDKKMYNYKGELHSKRVVAEGQKNSFSFREFAENLNDFFWYRRTVSEGSKGPAEYEFTKRRVVIAKDGLPWKTVWLIVKRTVGEKREYRYYISNANLSTRLETFVRLSGIRWAVEQCFEECKGELGMDHYELRKYTGWNRHMLVCMLAHFFLWHIRIRLGKKHPLLPYLRSECCLMLYCR